MSPSAGEFAPERGVRGVVAVTAAVGAALLAATVNVERGSPLFFAAGFALAAVWTLGSWLGGGRRHVSGPLVRHAAPGVAVGVGMFIVFLVGAWAGRRLDVLENAIDDILRQADAPALGWVIALAVTSAFAEELFFRGALTDALPIAHAGLWSTLIYVFVTAAGGNLALVLAAAVMGTVFAFERRLSGGLVVPIATHVVWSLLMLTAFPRS